MNLAIFARIRELADDEDSEEILADRPELRKSPELLVIVHPGDITEPADSYDSKEYPSILDRSFECQWNIAKKIREWKGDFAILHRFSSFEFAEQSNCASPELIKALKSIHQTAVLIAYGDDLEDFVTQLRPHLESRTKVLVTGAYRDPKYGCVDEVARLINEVNVPVFIDPEAYAC